MIKTILFASDMGVHTPYLLHHVNALAMQHDARVVVLHAIEPVGHLGDAVVKSFLSAGDLKPTEPFVMDTIVRGVKQRLIDMLEDELMDGHSGLSLIEEVRVMSAKPVEAVMEAIADCQADMVIMGSHGCDAPGDNILGSVTSRVLRMSRVPVYMVPVLRRVNQQAFAS